MKPVKVRLSERLAAHPDRQRLELKIGTTFIEHIDDLWPEGGGPDAEWIRGHVDDILTGLELMLRHDGRDVRRLPHRLHWLLWLLDEIDQSIPRSSPQSNDPQLC